MQFERPIAALKRWAVDATAAVLVTLAIGFVLASLSAAGVITMTLAITLLVLAWIVGMASTILLTHIWNPSHKHRAVFGTLLAGMLFLLGRFEYKFQPTEAHAAFPLGQQSTPVSPPEPTIQAVPPPAPHQGPVTVKDAKDCPPYYMVLDSNSFVGNGIAISVPADAQVCLVNNTLTENKLGIELRQDHP